ncbi:hypothetical protein [Desulfocicer niacini]
MVSLLPIFITIFERNEFFLGLSLLLLFVFIGICAGGAVGYFCKEKKIVSENSQASLILKKKNFIYLMF